MHPTSRYQPMEATCQPPITSSTQPVSKREWPALTIYPDGMANLNGLATELLWGKVNVALVPPPPTKPDRLAKAWQLHGSPASGGVRLFGRCDRGQKRFRDAAAAKLLFVGVNAHAERLSFVLTPEPGHVDRFRLLPIQPA